MTFVILTINFERANMFYILHCKTMAALKGLTCKGVCHLQVQITSLFTLQRVQRIAAGHD